MPDIVISIENVSKRYRIGGRKGIQDSFAGVLIDFVKRPFRNLKRLRELSTFDGSSGDYENTIWALKDVSFDVKQGEVIGIIGSNGSGKSTLLRIISRITEPTEGRGETKGRIGSLLEVGTGFHPELTGRENIYLNGTILGMKRGEIDNKFDEIVDFSGVEKFIDTPVKRYSSGMRVRLAFAVAAHVEPEILLIDEVLAVGDAAFQKKCLGKMQDVASEGRTILFVSHNMVAVKSLCARAIWLDGGTKKSDGETGEVIADYLKDSDDELREGLWPNIESAPGNNMVRLHRVRVVQKAGHLSDRISMVSSFGIEVLYWNLLPDNCLDVTLHICTEQGIVAFGTGTVEEETWHGRPFPIGLFRSICYIPGNLLNSGVHSVKLLIVKDQGRVIFSEDNILKFEVVDSSEARGSWYGKLAGAVRPRLRWRTEQVTDRVQSLHLALDEKPTSGDA